MSDAEEPPTKMSKYTELQYLEEEALEEGMEEGMEGTLDEGQEEWLSEGVVTDEDCQPETMDQDRSDSNLGNTSQEEPDTMPAQPTETTSIPSLPTITDVLPTTPISYLSDMPSSTTIPAGNNLAIEITIPTVTSIPTRTSLPTTKTAVLATVNVVPTTVKVIPTAVNVFPTTVTAVEAKSNMPSVFKVSDDNVTVTETTNVKHQNGLEDMGINIEETLNNWDGDKTGDLPDDLDAFLIRKTDGKVVEAKVKEENGKHKVKLLEEDDGNDTDDLLRMLSEGGEKSKKKSHLRVTSEQNKGDSTDDDEFIYERSKVQTVKLSKNAMSMKTATKAVPENMSDGDDDATDASSEEAHTMERMFGMAKKRASLVKASKAQSKSPAVVQRIVRLNTNQTNKAIPKNHTPVTQLTKNIRNSIIKSIPSHITKPVTKSPVTKSPLTKSSLTKSPLTKSPANSKPTEVKTPAPFKPFQKTNPEKSLLEKLKLNLKDVTLKSVETGEIIDGDEFLEGNRLDLNEEEFEDSDDDYSDHRMKIRRPEQMDEECPSDSQSEGGSLYDEVPSSDSEDMGNWFSLDIRAERASDYLPLLGSNAQELLLAERESVSKRVEELQRSLSSLTSDAQRQAHELKTAAMALAEVDDTLRAT